MASLRDEAKAYEPPLTMNIADLASVPLDGIELKDGSGTNKDGETFTYKYIEFDGKEYRVPNSVLEEIQKILKLVADVKHVQVTKSGSGLSTRYKVDVISD